MYYEGGAIGGVYTGDGEENQVAMLNKYARRNDHPLHETLDQACMQL